MNRTLIYGKQDVLSTQKNTANHGWISDSILLAISFIVFYGIWIGSYPLFTPDEGRYSEVAREMIVTGDFITPRLNGIAFLDKPILYYWLQASAIYLFGIKEWSLRIWPALMGVIGSIVVYIAGRTLFSRRTGILSSVILATSPLYYGAAHYANLDLEVAVLISNALLFFIIAMNTKSQRANTIFLILAYIFAALATLTKGLIGIAFPAMIIGLWILILNRWKTLLHMRLVTGLLLYAVITAPWYILVQKANPQFFNYFFVLQQFSRFLTKADFNNQTTIWFYFPIVLAGFFPWTCFLFQALFEQIKAIWQDRQKYSSELFLMIWLVFIFTFFSIPKSKTIGYIIPVLPAISLIVGHYINKHWGQFTNIGIRSAISVFIVLNLIAAILLFLEYKINLFHLDLRFTPYLLTSGLFLSLATLITFIAFRLKHFTLLFCCITFATVSFLLCVISSAKIINQKSIKPVAEYINSTIKPDEEIVTYYRYFQDLPIYTQHRITIVADWNSSDIQQYDNWQRELWYHMHYVDSSAWLIENSDLLKKWNSDKRFIVLINDDFYPVLLQNLKEYLHTTPKSYLLKKFTVNEHDTIYVISNKAN